MPVEHSTDFDIDALHAALDSQRRLRGLSWPQVAREIGSLSSPMSARPISASTLTGLRKRSSIEGDGVLQMLRWLGRTPESFVAGGAEAAGQTATLPDVGAHQILRFDTRKLY